MQYNTIFSQLFHFIPRHRFEKKVKEMNGDRYCKGFTAWIQFLTCLYAQITGKDSLREIEQGLLVNSKRLYHLGMRQVPRSTLSDAMNRRPPEMFESLFDEVLDRATALAPGHRFKFPNPLYAIDSTTVDMCLGMYSWAKYKTTKGAIKLHTQLDLAGNIPCFVVMSDGRMSDIHAAREHFRIVPDSIYVYDRGYCDLEWFASINAGDAFFVTRLKGNARLEVVGQHSVSPASTGVVSDDVVAFAGAVSGFKYLAPLRKVVFHDTESGKTYEFLTNNFNIAAATVAAIYRRRWQIELFFKWIKQNLKIKSFLGTSRNAVMTQIWVALTHYLLVAYIKFLSSTRLTLTVITNRLREMLMSDFGLMELLKLDRKALEKPPDWNKPQQMMLFGEFLQ